MKNATVERVSPQYRNVLTFALALLGAASAPVFHGLDVRCWVYLPAHLAPLLAGLLLGARRGLLIGVCVAAADLFLGGRLEGLRAYAVMTELMAYGLVAGALRPQPFTIGGSLRALIGAMLAGRLTYLVWSLALGRDLHHALRGLFLTPWPGILIQIGVLPVLAWAITKVMQGEHSAVRIRIENAGAEDILTGIVRAAILQRGRKIVIRCAV